MKTNNRKPSHNGAVSGRFYDADGSSKSFYADIDTSGKVLPRCRDFDNLERAAISDVLATHKTKPNPKGK